MKACWRADTCVGRWFVGTSSLFLQAAAQRNPSRTHLHRELVYLARGLLLESELLLAVQTELLGEDGARARVVQQNRGKQPPPETPRAVIGSLGTSSSLCCALLWRRTWTALMTRPMTGETDVASPVDAGRPDVVACKGGVHSRNKHVWFHAHGYECVPLHARTGAVLTFVVPLCEIIFTSFSSRVLRDVVSCWQSALCESEAGRARVRAAFGPCSRWGELSYNLNLPKLAGTRNREETLSRAAPSPPAKLMLHS